MKAFQKVNTRRNTQSWRFVRAVILVVFGAFAINTLLLGATMHVISQDQVRLLPSRRQDEPVTSKTQPASNNKQFAYVWLVGGIEEQTPVYRGFIYSVLLSVYHLRRLGSIDADFWLYAQPSSNSSLTEMPLQDANMLDRLGIDVRFIPKPTQSESSFAQTVYEKFRPLELTQYKRILFLDADILPLVNLDYIFHLSSSSSRHGGVQLRPNMILASRGEPCNAGMFLLEPLKNSYNIIQKLIEKQREAAKRLPYPHFDRSIGWGHVFDDAKSGGGGGGDMWESIAKNGSMWRWHAVHSDQGLLYHYVKYVVQDVSIVIGDRVEHFKPGGTSNGPTLISQVSNSQHVFHDAPKPVVGQYGCELNNVSHPEFHHMCRPFYRDVVHFMGKVKPWQLGRNLTWDLQYNGTTYFVPKGIYHKEKAFKYWWIVFQEMDEEYNMGINVKEWEHDHRDLMGESSPLGYMAMYSDSAKLVLQ